MEQTNDTRQNIMWATYRVLSEHGFAGLTTQRVADEAGCSQSLIHYHFDTKEDLVVAFLEWIRSEEATWLDALAEGSAEERLRRFIEIQLLIPHDDEHGAFNVAFLELQAAAARNERYAAVIRDFSRLLQATLADVIRDGIEAGEFRDVDAEATARFLQDALHGATRTALTIDEPDAKTETRTAIETYLDRVLIAEEGQA